MAAIEMRDAGDQGGVEEVVVGTDTQDVRLHPLVLLNIAEHYTRMRIIHEKSPPVAASVSQTLPSAPVSVFGALVGRREGRRVEIHNSYEFVVTMIEDKPVVDMEYLQKKKKEVAKVFPEEWDMFLGWYTNGLEASDKDLLLLRQLLPVNENPFFLILNPNPDPGAKDLAAHVYEIETHVVQDAPTYCFAKLSYRIETEESERIAVEHVASASMAEGESSSKAAEHLMTMDAAIRMLNSRLIQIQKYLSAVEKGKLPRDERILRKIRAVCLQVPTINTQEFESNLLTEYNDTLLVAYLAALTKGTGQLDQLASKVAITQSVHGLS